MRIDPLMLNNIDPPRKYLIARATTPFSYQLVDSKAFYIKPYLYLLSSLAWVSFLEHKWVNCLGRQGFR